MSHNLGRLVAWVTGGARGLGRATAENLVKRGGKVAIIDLPNDDGIAVAKDIHEENCIYCPCDITETNDIIESMEMTQRTLGDINVLVNCAGTSTMGAIYNIGRNQPHNMEEFEKVMDVNITGTFNVIRLVTQQMAKNQPDSDGQRGVIVNTSAIAAFDGEQGQLANAVSSAAVNSMNLPLSRELARFGIRVNTISLGYIDSPLFSLVPEKIKDFIISMLPFPQRFGKPEEFAAMVQTLVDNRYINGEVIRYDAALRLTH